MVLARPDERETCPYHSSLLLFTMVRRSSCDSCDHSAVSHSRNSAGNLAWTVLFAYYTSTCPIFCTRSRLSVSQSHCVFDSHEIPQWGAADAKIKVPSGENTELKRSSLNPVGQYYSHICSAYYQGFLLPFRSIHLHFFKTLSISFVLAVAKTWFLRRSAE